MNARGLCIVLVLVIGACKGGTSSDRQVGPDGGTVSDALVLIATQLAELMDPS